MNQAESLFLASKEAFLSQKQLADQAVCQVSRAHFNQPLPGDTNSIAIVMQHVAGNLRSRWTDFLTSDGEKPGRDRDSEFVDHGRSRDEILADWEQGWSCVVRTLDALNPADLLRQVVVRGESLGVPFAIQRSLAHASYHIGQIILIARIHAGADWRVLTIPRGGSRQYNRDHWGPLGHPPE